MIIEGHTVIPGVTRHLSQVRHQSGCDGLLVLGDRFRQSLELASPNAQCDRRIAPQVFPPDGVGKNAYLIAVLRIADRGRESLATLAPGVRSSQSRPGVIESRLPSVMDLLTGSRFVITCSGKKSTSFWFVSRIAPWSMAMPVRVPITLLVFDSIGCDQNQLT